MSDNSSLSGILRFVLKDPIENFLGRIHLCFLNTFFNYIYHICQSSFFIDKIWCIDLFLCVKIIFQILRFTHFLLFAESKKLEISSISKNGKKK